MTINRTIELCGYSSRADVFKAVLGTTDVDYPFEVVPKFVTVNGAQMTKKNRFLHIKLTRIRHDLRELRELIMLQRTCCELQRTCGKVRLKK